MNATTNIQEQEELEYNLAARFDYLYEAFGGAVSLEYEAECDRQTEEEAWLNHVGPDLPVQYACPVGPSLDDDLPF